ncbi:hypothetical protein ACFVVM_05635 [Nocardia sp. NPDC058176]|uniref:hypothetical protein n=1 Tax=Nocardia sp. NPDC058176 TaxID=3346368 RepID=UPI0036DF1E0C
MKKNMLAALVVGVGVSTAAVGLAAPASAFFDPTAHRIGDACGVVGARDNDPWGTPIVCVDPDPYDQVVVMFWAHA